MGFHGCDETVRDKVVSRMGELLKPSENDYDWLGHGIYFWENNYERALQYANNIKKNPGRSKQQISKPSVLGAVIDLGHCLDFLDSEYLELLKVGYDFLRESTKKLKLPIPENKPVGKAGDLLLRHLDCAVIQVVHQINEVLKKPAFDSVRGVFFEGEDLYPNAGFKEKNHIQIAVRNINCIKGFFIPRELDPDQPKP